MKRDFYRQAAKNVREFRKMKLSRSVNCRYGVQESDGRLVISGVDYCHAGLQRHTLKDPVAVFNQIQDLRSGEDVARRYFEWLLNYSPFRSVFVTKSVRRALGTNLIIADAEAPANLMVGGLIATRLAWENYTGNGNYRSCVLWDMFVQRGVHPNAAFVLSHHLTPDEKFVNVEVHNINHSAINVAGYDYDENYDQVKGAHFQNTFWNFLSGRKQSLLSPYRVYKSYNNINKIWYSKADKKLPKIPDIVEKALTEVKKEKNKKNNPFAARDIRDIYPINEAVEEIAMRIKIAIQNKEAALAA